MGVWVAAASIVLAGTIVAIIYALVSARARSAKKRLDEGRVTEMRSDNVEQSVANLMSAQSEMAGRLSQLAEAQTRSQSGMMKTIEDRLDGVKLYMGRSLTEQADRTAQTLHQLHTRLAMIDEAQRNLSDLSDNMGTLQTQMVSNRTKGLFGEMQMRDLVSSCLPPSAYTFQKTLSNGRTADCLVELPNPPGAMVIDARFPLETYHALRAAKTEEERSQAERGFRNAVLKHVVDIAERYIVAGDTAESALMFLPSEAVYAELHANFPDVVEKSFRARVWIVSPTTMMATLNTVRAVLKDARMREQAQIIHRETGLMLDDVSRLQKRVLNLQAHFSQTEKDVREVLIAADKIARRAERIEEVQIGATDTPPMVEHRPAPFAPASLPEIPKAEAPEPAGLHRADPGRPEAPRAFTPRMTEAPKAPVKAASADKAEKKNEAKDPASVWANLWLSAMNSKKDKTAGAEKSLTKSSAVKKPDVAAAKIPNAFLPDPAPVKAGKEAYAKPSTRVPNATGTAAPKSPAASNLSFADISEDLAEFGVPLAALTSAKPGEKNGLRKLPESAGANGPETAAKAASSKPVPPVPPASKLYPAGLNPFVAPSKKMAPDPARKLPSDSRIEMPKTGESAKPTASAGHAIYFPAMNVASKSTDKKTPKGDATYVKNANPNKKAKDFSKRPGADDGDFDIDTDDRPTIWPLV